MVHLKNYLSSNPKTSIVIWTILISTTYFQGPLCASASSDDSTILPTEQSALDHLKRRVMPVLKMDFQKTNFFLIRWLRAQNLDVDDAEKMLLKHFKWRLDNKIDTILTEDWSDMDTKFPYTMDTHDLSGQPVGAVELDEWDVHHADRDKMTRYMYRFLEQLTGRIYDAQRQGQQNITRFVVLANADGFKHTCTLCIPHYLKFAKAFDANYPAFLDELVVIDASSTLKDTIALVHPAMSDATVSSLKIFGHDREKWMLYLDTVISRSQRRAGYGGTW